MISRVACSLNSRDAISTNMSRVSFSLIAMLPVSAQAKAARDDAAQDLRRAALDRIGRCRERRHLADVEELLDVVLVGGLGLAQHARDLRQVLLEMRAEVLGHGRL